jgi:hypothetical protein
LFRAAAPLLPLLILSAPASASAPGRQVFLRYRVEADGMPASVSRLEMRLWRSGTRYARMEIPLMPGATAEMVTVVDEPDAYSYTTLAPRGTRLKDPAGKVLMPLMPGAPAAFSGLEYGREVNFFRDHRAEREKDETRDGTRCAVFHLNLEGHDLRLYIDLSKKAPAELTMRMPGGGVDVHYDEYDLHQPFDASLYRPPKGFAWQDASAAVAAAAAAQSAAQRNRDIDTPFPKNDRWAGRYQLTKIGGRTFLNNYSCWDRPVFFFFFDKEHRDAEEDRAELASLYRRYKNTDLCFFPVVMDKTRVGARPKDFPLYVLEDFSGYHPPPGYFWNGPRTRMILIQRNGQKAYDGTPSRLQADEMAGRIERLVDDGSPESKVTADDVEEMRLRVDGELKGTKEQARLYKLLQARKFDEVDRLFASHRKERKRGVNGAWYLVPDYSDILWGIDDDESVQERMRLFQDWIDARPKSVTPRVALGKLWLNYGWKARGGGTVDQLNDEQKNLFQERLEKAAAVLEEARGLTEKDPEVQRTLIRAGQGLGWPRDRVEGILREGEKEFPGYQYMYWAMADYLLPKWEGSPGDWEAFAAAVQDEDPGGHGDELYVQIASLLSEESDFGWLGSDLFRKSALDWKRFKRGEDAIAKRYPDSKIDANYYAFFACAAGDKKTARERFRKLGDEYSPLVWGNRVIFERARRWAGAGG